MVGPCATTTQTPENRDFGTNSMTLHHAHFGAKPALEENRLCRTMPPAMDWPEDPPP